MESSLESIRPEKIEKFLRSICRYSSESRARNQARNELSAQIHKIRHAPKKWIFNREVDNLKEKVSKVVDVEKSLLKYSDSTRTIESLLGKINFLESELKNAKKERDLAVYQGRQELDSLKSAMSRLKSRVEIYLRAKEKRDQRLKDLEKKVKTIA